MFELMVEETFDAAHALRGYKGECENLHGHSWRVQANFRGDKLNDIGIMLDFREAKTKLYGILKKFDHKNLNDLPEFQNDNPSSENIARFIFENLKRGLPGLFKVTVWESTTTYASYYSGETPQ